MPGELELAAALHGAALYTEHISAELCPRKTVHNADLILFIYSVRYKPRSTEHIAQHFNIHADLRRALDYLHGALTAYRGYFAFEPAHAVFARVGADKLGNRFGADSAFRCGQSVRL